MRNIFTGLALIGLITLSCKKNNDVSANVTPTKDNLVGTYKLSKITIRMGSSETPYPLGQCQADDLEQLNADMTYNPIDAGLSCNPSGSFNSTWALNSSTAITIDATDYIIEKFDGKNLQLTHVVSGQTAVAYFVKQ